ncbi:hypothetical protein BSL78_25951, partial [Apostichopus japonicus]
SAGWHGVQQPRFIFTLLPLECSSSSAVVKVFIASLSQNTEASGNISFPLRDIEDIPFVTGENGSLIDIPLHVLPSSIQTLRKENSTAMISADRPVAAYVHLRCTEQQNNKATTFKLIPLDGLGTEYRVISYRYMGNPVTAVTAYNRTTVVNIIQSGISQTTTLMPYETILWESDSDLSGVYLVTDEPVFVVSGNKEDHLDGSTMGKDMFYECMPPLNDWGMTFSVAPLSDRESASILRIVPWNMTTIITWGYGASQWTDVIDSEDFKEIQLFPFPDGENIEISSDKPVLVMQFTSVYKEGQGTLTPSLSMATVTPSDKVIGRYLVFPLFAIGSVASDILDYHMTVWLPPGANTDFLLVNNNTPSWSQIGTLANGGMILRTSLNESTNTFQIHGTFQVRAAVYGWHRVSSFAYLL